MTLIILLFAIGVVLLAVEVIIPGGILGTLGGLSLLAATIVSFLEYGSIGGGIALVASIALSLGTLFSTFFVMRHTPMGRRAFLDTQITATSSDFEKESKVLIGKSAESVTMLSPGGLVRIEGKSYEAFCQSGQVPAGTPLQVIGADTFRLIVSPTTNPS